MGYSLVVYSALVCLHVWTALAAIPTVVTTEGEIRGEYVHYNDHLLEVYKGIPYAEPPLDSLRFKLPEPANKRNDVYNATSFGASCMQFLGLGSELLENEEVSEDCLTLNLYKSTNSSEPAPAIMVFIHGGGFTTGQGQIYDPRELVTKGEVIVVTINYRLGPFGFLSTGDENAPGNLALWDQILALEWVRDNAVAFGGDPERITIFGESAGGWSVSLLVVSPRSRGLFQRAISQSGVFPDALVVSRPLDSAKTLATLTDCDVGENTAELVACLQDVPADSILNALYVLPELVLAFYPIVDDSLLPSKPSKMLDVGGVDYMIGFNELEGYVMTFGTGLIENNTVNTGASQELFEQTLNSSKIWISLDDPEAIDRVLEVLKFGYTYWDDVDNSQKRMVKIIEFFGDMIFVAPSMEMARQHRKAEGSGATYLYYFTYKSSNPNLPLFSDAYAPKWNDKATHGDEINFLFPSFIKGNFTDQDNNVSDTMVTYWTNFARTGNPNEPNKENIPEWKVFGEDGKFIQLGEVAFEGDSSDLDPEAMNLWLDVIPSISRESDENCLDKEESTLNSLSLTQRESEIVIWVLLALVIILFLLLLIFCISYIVRCKRSSANYGFKGKPV